MEKGAVRRVSKVDQIAHTIKIDVWQRKVIRGFRKIFLLLYNGFEEAFNEDI